MNRISHGFSWKLLAGVFVLFLLSLLAPGFWKGWSDVWTPTPRQATERQPSRQADDQPRFVQTRTQTRTSTPRYERYELPAPALEEPAAEELAVAEDTTSQPETLAAYSVPSQAATPGPVVAEQIDLDPSITETPALPMPRPGIDDEVTPPDTRPQLELPHDQPLPPPAEPEHETPPATAAGVWAYPVGLVEQLKALAAADPELQGWSDQVIATLDQMSHVPTLNDPAAPQLIERLKQLAAQAREIATTMTDENRRSNILRAGYAIIRRVSIWEPVYQLASRAEPKEYPRPSPTAWKNSLADVYGRLNTTSQSATAWREYLILERARSQFGDSGIAPAEQRKLAREILHRMQSAALSSTQAEFLSGPPFDDFATLLRLWADETPDYAALLKAIEDYEHLELSEQSTVLTDCYQQLRWSSDIAVEELAETVNAYYRNANVRVAISAALVNRMLPRSNYTQEPVRDYIQGAYVEGASLTSTDLRLVLLPDRHSWRLGLEAKGAVTSTTASSKGPATFYQDGVSYYRARKLLSVDRRGIRMFTAQAEANANTYMTDFETDFDGIPLLGGLARNIARKQYDETSPLAKQEVEGKIVGRATSQLDREVALKLQEGKKNFQLKLLDPLRQLRLEPTAVDMETTLERLIARYRLAGRSQVAAHTPRPQAPGDSLLSVQIHESALNNVLENLQLQGRRVELRELYREITSRFSQGKALEPPEDLPEDVYVTFAEQDPVRIDCDNGRVRLTIRLKELEHGDRNRWTNFLIRAYYAPDSDQLDANLVRDGVIELGGERLRFGDQVALRGIFSRVLSRNRKLELVNKQIAQSPELRDQQVTQFVIHDGWIGVALGPKLPERTTDMTPVRKTGVRTK